MSPDSELRDMIRRYKVELLTRMFGDSISPSGSSSSPLSMVPRDSNIVGVGYGRRGNALPEENDPALRVYVSEKQPESTLLLRERIPAQVNGLATDVIPVGKIVAAARPTDCGVNVGHMSDKGGTLGCLVRTVGAGGPPDYILSNNHVLAASNGGSPGDDILEPDKAHGGNPANPIASLTTFVPLLFGGGNNTMDAAIAQILVPGDVLPQIHVIGNVVSPPMSATVGQSVHKYGATTHRTAGIIDDIAADIPVAYNADGTIVANFVDQIAVNRTPPGFSWLGDSGSLIVDLTTNRPLGLIFAIESQLGLPTTGMAFASPIGAILTQLNIQIV
jgi:hypothetical protein